MPSDYARIAAAIRYLDTTTDQQPALAEVAAHVGLSSHHFQRMFRRYAGVSPKRFLQFLTTESARASLEDSASTIEAALSSGLSGSGRLHDLICAVEGVTPGELKRAGGGVNIRWGAGESPLGTCIVGQTERGVCWLDFLDDGPAQGLQRLSAAWPAAVLQEDAEGAAALLAEIFSDIAPRPPLLLKGTNFQLQVWRALLRVPPGTLTTYGGLAQAIGRPGAAQAVGQAVGSNPVAWLIPCHRVIRKTGGFASYRWGLERKKVLIGREAAQALSATA